MTEITVDLGQSPPVGAIVYPPAARRLDACLILGHGAGAGQRSPFMVAFARGFAALGIDVVTFNFPYMENRRRLPDRRPVLENCYRAVVETMCRELPSARQALFIGGKSMGGRIATHLAAADRSLPLAGLVLLGYPLHPPGKPGERRDTHLPDVRRPMLFVQGSRDAFGTPSELAPVISALAPPGTLYAIEGGDHSFKASKYGTDAQTAIYDDVQRTVVEWMEERL